MLSFNATLVSQSRSASIDLTPDGYRANVGDAQIYPRFSHALNAVRDYLGPFLAPAEQRRDLPWSLSVSVRAGTAFYGTRPPHFGGGGGGGVPVEPSELLVKIRQRYEEGDGPIAALQNALQIGRAYAPEPERRVA